MSDTPTWRRRHFIAAAGVAGLLPAFLQKAFACPPPSRPPVVPGCPALPDGVGDVSAAFRKAVAVGKPLLVIVIPAEAGQKHERGELWGEVLNHGSPSTWAALACAEVVCATAAALNVVVPGLVAGEPLFALVETDTLPVTASSHTVAVPDYPRDWGRGGGADWQQRQEQEKQLGLQRIALLGGLIEQALFGANSGALERPLLARRVEQTRSTLADTGGARTDDNGASLLVQAGDVDRATAAAMARLKVARVRGSKWAVGGGCGVSVEGENDDVGIACGMGHTPALSRRFLYWFTKTSEG